jgi:hypothetical protein
VFSILEHIANRPFGANKIVLSLNPVTELGSCYRTGWRETRHYPARLPGHTITQDAARMEHANRSRATMVYMDKGRHPKVVRTWMTDKIRKAMSAQRRVPTVPRKPEPHNNT